MLLHIKGSNKATRALVDLASKWYAEKLMGKRLTKNLDMEGSAIWEDEGPRPREFTIEIDSSMSIRNILITLAHEMVHIKQWAKDEMYEYYNTPKMVRFKGEKMHMDKVDYWDYPWEIEAFGRQLGLFVRFCNDVGIADHDDMKENV